VLQLNSGQAINPLSRVSIERVTFTVMGDRLLYLAPPEFVGGQPINLAFLTSSSRLEDLVIGTLNDHLYQLERRSSELAALGISPRVDPVTLQLAAELEVGGIRVTIGPTRAGQFRVTKARREGAELTTGGQTTFFELSEFRDRKALEDFILAMYGEAAPEPEARATPAPEGAPEQSIPFRDLIHAFGDGVLPPRSSLEVLATVTVGSQQLRFAAARVQGQTFRGLLAGASGKVWADRFELGDFPGIRALVAEVLHAPLEEIEVRVP
jgi:hypothetical protein